MAAGEWTVDKAYEVDKICEASDFINLMSYDLHGSWESFTGHNSPLYTEVRYTVGQINQKRKLKNWATRSSVRLFTCTAHSFARTTHSFACFGLLASLAPSAALTRSLARSLRSPPRSWESEFLMSQNGLVLSHSALLPPHDKSHQIFR